MPNVTGGPPKALRTALLYAQTGSGTLFVSFCFSNQYLEAQFHSRSGAPHFRYVFFVSFFAHTPV